MAIEKKTLLYRLKFYGFGFALGCIVVYFSLIKDRDRPSFMPEGRVIEFLEKANIQINDHAKCKLDCYSISYDFINADFWTTADVNFKESATDRKPCPEYYITGILSDGKDVVVYIETCELEERATLRNIELLNHIKCNCD
jgi:hypothetical protein